MKSASGFSFARLIQEKRPRFSACGQKQETPPRYNTGHLASAFDGSDKEKDVFSQLRQGVMDIPAGYEVLSQAFPAGYRFAYEAGMNEGGQSGACDAGSKSILLEPARLI